MLIGLAIATQVHATATTRTKVLTARLMAFSLHAGSLGAETLMGGIISLLSSLYIFYGECCRRCADLRAKVLKLGAVLRL